jgi:hypothetical protein
MAGVYYTNQYVQILKPEMRISKTQILPRNIYRISTYEDGDPRTKIGRETRYVFVIGKVDKKIHCLLLNHVPPVAFIQFLNKLRDRTKPIPQDGKLNKLLRTYSMDGHALFETFVKNNRRIYSHRLDNYRSYFIDKIQNVWEIRFEDGFLREVFKESLSAEEIKEDVKKEVRENDG